MTNCKWVCQVNYFGRLIKLCKESEFGDENNLELIPRIRREKDWTHLKKNDGMIEFSMKWVESLFKQFRLVKWKTSTISYGFVREAEFTIYRGIKRIFGTFDIIIILLFMISLPTWIQKPYFSARDCSRMEGAKRSLL